MVRVLSFEEQKYNRESLLCDDFWEFHPEIFSVLSDEEKADLLRYYPQDFTDIPDVFKYRRLMLGADPGLEGRARALLVKVLTPIGVDLSD